MYPSICPRCGANDINDFDETRRCRVCGCRQQVSTEPELFYQTRLNHIVTNALKSDVRRLIGLLACAATPLDRAALSRLFINSETDYHSAQEAVDSALHTARCLVEVVRESDKEAFTLALQLQTAIKNSLDLDISGSLIEAENILYWAAFRWAELPAGSLREHLCRYGNSYMIEFRELEGAMIVAERLRNFYYLQARLANCSAKTKIDQLLHDYQQALKFLPDDSELQDWYRIISATAQILRRGSPVWPADKIFTQLICELIIDENQRLITPEIKKKVMEWLKAGKCDWVWLRREGLDQAEVFQRHYQQIDQQRYIGRARDYGIELIDTGRAERSIAQWHGEIGEYFVRQILPDGTIIVTNNEEVIILKLYRGNQRIGFDQLADELTG